MRSNKVRRDRKNKQKVDTKRGKLQRTGQVFMDSNWATCRVLKRRPWKYKKVSKLIKRRNCHNKITAGRKSTTKKSRIEISVQNLKRSTSSSGEFMVFKEVFAR